LNRLLSTYAVLLMTVALPSSRAQTSTTTADTAAGARTFSTNCSGCHGADGRGGERAPNIATARNIIALSDEDLESIVKKGVPGTGMPSFSYLGDQGAKDVVAHLRVLQGRNATTKATGDATAGHTLFFGRAECSQCHMVKGEGGYMASDLTDYAAGLTQDAILLAITKPDAVLAPTSAVVDLTLPDGQHLTGMARAEDNFHITVQTNDGRWHTFDKSKLTNIQRTGHSTHPRDYDTRLSAKELDDVVSYLVVSSANAPAKPARRRNH